jgi:RNA polymerase sigma-70 factor (ECF subfamily)
MFRACHLAVHRFALRRVGDGAVDDIVAETFTIAWRRHSEIVGDPLPWLLGVARRVCANHLRASGRRAALGRRLSDQGPSFSDDIAISDGRLRAALAMLGDRDREALLLIAWDELSNSDAAQVVGCSPSAFAVRLHRARKRLALALDEPGAGGTGLTDEARVTSDAH